MHSFLSCGFLLLGDLPSVERATARVYVCKWQVAMEIIHFQIMISWKLLIMPLVRKGEQLIFITCVISGTPFLYISFEGLSLHLLKLDMGMCLYASLEVLSQCRMGLLSHNNQAYLELSIISQSPPGQCL